MSESLLKTHCETHTIKTESGKKYKNLGKGWKAVKRDGKSGKWKRNRQKGRKNLRKGRTYLGNDGGDRDNGRNIWKRKKQKRG